MNWSYAFTYFWTINLWILGIATCNGFWKTLFAFFIPPLAWIFAFEWIINRV